MKKIIPILSILLLILITALIKNSTKKIEDETFIVSENLRSLKNELGDVLLEYNYLSSPKKLLQYQSQFFEKNLTLTNITKIKIINENDNKLLITDLVEKLEENE